MVCSGLPLFGNPARPCISRLLPKHSAAELRTPDLAGPVASKGTRSGGSHPACSGKVTTHHVPAEPLAGPAGSIWVDKECVSLLPGRVGARSWRSGRRGARCTIPGALGREDQAGVHAPAGEPGGGDGWVKEPQSVTGEWAHNGVPGSSSGWRHLASRESTASTFSARLQMR